MEGDSQTKLGFLHPKSPQARYFPVYFTILEIERIRDDFIGPVTETRQEILAHQIIQQKNRLARRPNGKRIFIGAAQVRLPGVELLGEAGQLLGSQAGAF